MKEIIMGRILLIFGIVLMVVAMGLLLFMVTATESETFTSLMQRLHCTEKEEFSMWMGSYQPTGTFGNSYGRPVVWSCVLPDSEEREVTGRVVLTLVVVFVVPFVLGLIMLLSGIGLMVKRGVSGLMGNVLGRSSPGVQSTVIDLRQGSAGYENLPPQARQMIDSLRQGMTSQSVNMVSNSSQSGSTLVDKLRQLEEAYNQAFISKEEYDKARAALLDKIDD
jgi:hypothetical protein